MEAQQNTRLEMVMHTQRNLESLVESRIADFEKRLTPSTDATTDHLRTELVEFKQLVHSILQLLQEQIQELNQGVDRLEMRCRRKFLLLNGVAEESNESVKLVATKLMTGRGFPDNSNNIKDCHRIGVGSNGRPRPILMQFHTLEDKVAVWGKKSLLRGTPVTLSEFLTRPRQAVFMSARSHFGMKRCWTMDGVIHIKTEKGDHFKVTSAKELSVLVSKFPNNTLSGSSGSGLASGDAVDCVTSVNSGLRAGIQAPKYPHKTTDTADKKTLTRRQAQAVKPK